MTNWHSLGPTVRFAELRQLQRCYEVGEIGVLRGRLQVVKPKCKQLDNTTDTVKLFGKGGCTTAECHYKATGK